MKDGYIQIDQSPIDAAPLKMLFEIATVRVGHMEIDYGDAHFRRRDNGNAVYNPFVGNYILDPFTTEIGGEVYLKTAGVIAMGAITGGEIRGTVVTPGQRGPAFVGKLGVDRQVSRDLRLRVTGSIYKTDKAVSSSRAVRRGTNRNLEAAPAPVTGSTLEQQNPVGSRPAKIRAQRTDPGEVPGRPRDSSCDEQKTPTPCPRGR